MEFLILFFLEESFIKQVWIVYDKVNKEKQHWKILNLLICMQN